VDSATLMSALPDLTREETRTSKISRVGTNLVTERMSTHGEHGEVEEKEVVVQVTDDGTELTFPDGGRDVSTVDLVLNAALIFLRRGCVF
jgi:hypothetical protein